MQNLILIFNMVAPVFLIVAIGYLLKKIGIINDNFVKVSSKIVFTISLPALIFSEIAHINIEEVFDLKQLAFVYAGTITSFIISWALAEPYLRESGDKSSFIQGSFRGNFAIVGIALIINIFGEQSLAKASIILAFVIPLYNVLSVAALIYPARIERNLNLQDTFWEIFKNPLIISILLALPVSYFKIELGTIVTKTIDYFAALTLPLALLGIGGFLSFGDIKKASVPAFYSTALKIILFPLLSTIAAYLLGYRNEDLGILFILFASPTAISSFVMAEAMGANSRLAGNIVLITTLGSVLTISLGLFILKENGLI